MLKCVPHESQRISDNPGALPKSIKRPHCGQRTRRRESTGFAFSEGASRPRAMHRRHRPRGLYGETRAPQRGQRDDSDWVASASTVFSTVQKISGSGITGFFPLLLLLLLLISACRFIMGVALVHRSGEQE
jgi:hypothetical protein